MPEPISSLETKPKYFTPLDDPPTPLAPKATKAPPKPAVDLDYVPPPSAAPAFKVLPGSPPPLASVDVTSWPTRLLEKNVAALAHRLATSPGSATAADRAHLAKMEGELAGRYAKETAPMLPGITPPPAKVEFCKRPANITGNDLIGGALKHHWLRTSHVEVGMGAEGRGVPGHDAANNGTLFGRTTLNDHAGEGELVDADCEELPQVDEACVEKRMKIGTYTGRWTPGLNDCHTVVAKVVKDCTKPEGKVTP
jgi:hypothetical protein